ncbi:DUF4148 domain-containing protein [Aquabacterium sp.]|uniref:DUF4148 domain-containing protein n=1 Tax=Aquabacterium sp. TaxID=1872578 RepID=UPI002B65A170|nr:DUF4148 domain-containing protein [Aquabacterium sp.]HSW03366.1 DUF4148 domain-containing protein [Aquabacterium sp.]
MNKLMIAALTVFATGAALADDPTIDNSANTLTLKTRAQVVAELKQAQADGSISAWANRPQMNKAQDIKSVRVRADVKSDVIAARAAGDLNTVTGEDSGALAFNAKRRVTTPTTVVAASQR